MEDEDEMYEPLLNDIDVETLMEEDDLEIETGSQESRDLRGSAGGRTLVPRANHSLI